MTIRIRLEKQALAFTEETANPPFLFELGPEKGRETVNEVQSEPVKKPKAEVEVRRINAQSGDAVPVKIVRPVNAAGKLPVIVYIHGGGWVFGNTSTHDRLIRELATGAQAAVVFPEYKLSPEAKYPTALEEIYTVVEWVASQGEDEGFDPERLTVAGDSAGGNMAAAVTILSKERNGPPIWKQLLFYPVTDASFETESYRDFATGYFLRRDAMKWFWDQYTTDPAERNQITASPLRASADQLRGLPEALIITAEADVLRDEGEAYANLLREAEVAVTAVRFQGAIHDFVMLNPLADTQAAKGALLLATSWLRAF